MGKLTEEECSTPQVSPKDVVPQVSPISRPSTPLTARTPGSLRSPAPPELKLNVSSAMASSEEDREDGNVAVAQPVTAASSPANTEPFAQDAEEPSEARCACMSLLAILALLLPGAILA